jgi:hypothetical protein
MKVLIVGHKGNMGRRYQAILNKLNVSWEGIDSETGHAGMVAKGARATHTIVATPTDTHGTILRALIPCGKPILCEKPITRDAMELDELRYLAKQNETPVSMVAQYSQFLEGHEEGDSFYDFYKHGDDGMFWDCIQIIGQAKSRCLISETSPVWKCQINGVKINPGLMDQAYVDYISNWLKGVGVTLEEAAQWHRKVHEKIRGANEPRPASLHRNTSALHQR